MKKKTSAILAVLASVFCFSACDQVQNMLEQLGVNSNTASSLEETASDSLTESTADGSTEDPNSSTEDSNSSTEDSNSSTEDSNSSTEAPNSSMEDEEDEKKYTYNAFTPSEKQLCETYLGEALPFVANNEYYIETFEGEDGYTWVNFYTYGNTQADFNAYLDQFSGYTFVETSYDEDGDAWYCYEKGDIYVEVAYYVYDGDCVIDVYAINEGEETGGDDDGSYLYHEFTSQEEALFTQYIGEVIPFLPNDEYYVEGYYEETDYENGMCYLVCDVTAMGFALYRGMYSDYDFVDEYKDEEGDTWYCYEKDDVCVEMVYYYYEGAYYMEVYVTSSLSEGGNEDVGGDDDGGAYLYYEFTSQEEALFTQYIGEVIPFLPNDEYYVEGYYEETDYENGMCYLVCDVTEMGFALYRGMYSDYDFVDEYKDEEGDTWYCYEKDDVCVEMVYYYYEGMYYMEVYVTSSLSEDGGDVGGGDIGGGDVGGDDNNDLLTNNGKGLPTDADGVYDVDFTKATYVKNVTDQGYYLDGCPTTGTVKVLVIPVEFSDVTAASKGYSTSKLNTAFNGASGTTDYHSVSEYYSISSYGKLDLDFVVLDNWFRPAKTSTYYKNQTMDYYGSQVEIGDQMIMDEALAYLESRMDLSQFDSDNNNIIDAVVMINTLDIDSDTNFNWAYRYWNLYTDNSGYYYEYDQVSANDYIWASYQFLMETYDNEGYVYYDKNTMNTYTFIHEFGHVLGVDDYYDTAYVGSPMGGYDIMDSMTGDQNAYSKFNLGWLTNTRLVVAEESITLTLDAFENNGDTIIIANNWDDVLGAYQEYFIVVYYTNTSLNGGVNGYFSEEGIVVYHINASLYPRSDIDGEYYDVYYNNTDASDQYGTTENLIEYVTTAGGAYVYGVGDSLASNVKTDAGEKIAYTFTVKALTGTSATITFEKNN